MIQSALDFKVIFELNNDPKNIKVNDTTDYAGQGITLANVNGILKITAPGAVGIIHNNIDFGSPDIDPDVDLNYVGTDLPLDGASAVVKGIYNFIYTIQITAAITDVTQGSKIFQIAGDLVQHLPVGTTFKISGSTGNDGTYTVATAILNGPNTDITVVEAIPDATVDGTFELEVNKSLDQDFQFDCPEADILQTADCFCGILTSTDNTSYGDTTTLVRTHTVKSPESVVPTPADVVTTQPSAQVTPIFSPATYTTLISTVATYDFADLLQVVCLVEGTKEFLVECDLNACDIFCCLDKTYKRWIEKRGTNETQAAALQNTLDAAFIALQHFQNAVKCGDNDRASQIHKDILDITNCEPGCSCDGDEPTQVVPICGPTGGAPSITVVATCGNGILVSPNTIGDTTTYTLCLDQTIIDSLVGPKGDKGDQGDPGIQGIPGDQGIPGSDGNDGDSGLPGSNGSDGDDGLGYVATSATTATIQDSPYVESFTISPVPALTAYTVGTRVRVSSNSTPEEFVEGVITSVTGTDIVLAVDLSNGVGNNYNLWDVHVAGETDAGRNIKAFNTVASDTVTTVEQLMIQVIPSTVKGSAKMTYTFNTTVAGENTGPGTLFTVTYRLKVNNVLKKTVVQTVEDDGSQHSVSLVHVDAYVAGQTVEITKQTSVKTADNSESILICDANDAI